MQYNLDFIKKGQIYPPRSEACRIAKYRDMLNLYRGHTEQVVNGYWARFNGGDKTQNVKFIELNYFKLIASKTADLVCGEKPDVVYPDDINIKDKEIVSRIIEQFNKKLRKSVIDFVRFSESVLRPYRDAEGNAKVALPPPELWVPVVNEEDTSEFIHHVIGFPDTINGQDVLVIQVHSKGYYEQYTYKTTKAKECYHEYGKIITLESYQINREIDYQKVFTGIDGFAVEHVANEQTSDNIHGTSDFEAIVSLVADLEVRFAQRDIILDKHASPSMAAAREHFELSRNEEDKDYTGKKLNVGKAWIIGENGQIPQYVTWDGQLEAVEQDIQDKMQQLFILSEMGAVIDDNVSGSTTLAFETIQARMVNARLKARRITEEYDEIYKRVVKNMFKLETGREMKFDINVTWNDGLPNDTKRDAEVATIEINSGLKSKKTIRKEYYNMTDKQAEEEQEQIDAETPAPVFETGFTLDD